jgi:hypothetical protein
MPHIESFFLVTLGLSGLTHLQDVRSGDVSPCFLFARSGQATHLFNPCRLFLTNVIFFIDTSLSYDSNRLHVSNLIMSIVAE